MLQFSCWCAVRGGVKSQRKKGAMAEKPDTLAAIQMLESQLAHIEQDQDVKIAHLKRILDVTRVLNSTLDRNVQLKMIQEVATELTRTTDSSTFLFDRKTGELYAEVATGEAAEKLKRIVVPLEGSIAGWVIKTGQPAVVNDVQHDSRHYNQADKLVSDDQTQFVTRSILAVPLEAQGKIIGVLEVVNKVGDQPFTDEDLELLETLAAQAAVAIEKARLFEQSDLVSEVVHELRTPMTSIIGYSKMLSMPGIPEETKAKFTETIHREATRLGKMVNDFLDWARLESGRVRFTQAQVDMCRLVNETVQVIEPQAQERGIRIEKSIPGESMVVTGDEARLKQVLVNLASNGVKYNRDDGMLAFDVQRVQDRVSIAVRDTGMGIPQESLEKLFERFYRVPGTENIVRGAGLGLNITKSLVEAHGGEIRVDSVVGEGTTFTIVLPLASPA
jgi:signal transduction histidine kinase